MSHWLLQKRPDGQSEWSDREGENYNFSHRLPNARRVSKNDLVLFYRPVKSGTDEDGAIYAQARVQLIEVGDRGRVDAILGEFVRLSRPVPLDIVGDPRSNPQHSLQPVSREFFHEVLRHAGGNEGVHD